MFDTGKALEVQGDTLRTHMRRLAAELRVRLEKRTLAALAAVLAFEETVTEFMKDRREAARNLRHWLGVARLVMPEAVLSDAPDPDQPWMLRLGNLWRPITWLMMKNPREWALVEARNILTESGLFGPTRDDVLTTVFKYAGAVGAAAAAGRARHGLPRVRLSDPEEIPPEERDSNTRMWASAADALLASSTPPPARRGLSRR